MNEKLATILRNKWTVPTSVGAVSFSLGVGVGYFIMKKQAEKIVDDFIAEMMLNAIIEEPEDIPDDVQVVVESSPDAPSIIDQITERARTDYQALSAERAGIVLNPVRDPAEIVVEDQPNEEQYGQAQDIQRVNVFQHDPTDWSYEAELSTRTPDHPYIIHKDEFENEEMGYSQTSLTYYAGDDMLCDESEVPIYNPSSIVGDLRFGHGSNDPNTVFIRNERLHAEYEVTREPGSYEVEVLGLQIQEEMDAQLEHSRHRVGKFRQE